MHTESFHSPVCIDSHQHFWKYGVVRHNWITDDMSAIRKDFMPDDLYPLLKQNGVSGCVAVQAQQTEEETIFLLELAATNTFIKGVVGWVNLATENISERLDQLSQHNVLRGFRHILQSEVPEYMLQPAFQNGIAALEPFGYTYDILILPHHLGVATKLIKSFPGQRFVIDHLAKPYIKSGLISEWKKAIQELAQYPNVYCKVSGMVTEADHANWKALDLFPYIDVVVEAFGINRVMYGSDWPVCLVAADYTKVMQVVQEYFSTFSKSEQELFFGKNAVYFYGL